MKCLQGTLGTASMKVLVPTGVMFFLKAVEGFCECTTLAHSCVASNALKDMEHGVLGTRGIIYNTRKETTIVCGIIYGK